MSLSSDQAEELSGLDSERCPSALTRMRHCEEHPSAQETPAASGEVQAPQPRVVRCLLSSSELSAELSIPTAALRIALLPSHA